jgi:hypothetical protein
MIPSSSPAHSSTPPQVARAVAPASDAPEEEDLALGWECAYPALQIDVWGSEASAQPLQQVY